MFSTLSSRSNLKSNSFSSSATQYHDTYCVTLSFSANLKLQLMQWESLKFCLQQKLTAWRLSTSNYFIAPQTTSHQVFVLFMCFNGILLLLFISQNTPSQWKTWISYLRNKWRHSGTASCSALPFGFCTVDVVSQLSPFLAHPHPACCQDNVSSRKSLNTFQVLFSNN